MTPLVCSNKSGARHDVPERRRSKRKREREDRSERFTLRLEPSELSAWITAAAREKYLSVSDWMRDRLNSAAKGGVHLSSNFDGWNTPAPVLRLIRRAFGRHSIGLDPCSNADSIVRAKVEWTIEDDAFRAGRDWILAAAALLIYVNPPYGREIVRWMAHCAKLGESGALDGTLGLITLVPARTDSKWFRNAAKRAPAFILWPGRLRFKGAASTAPFPVALFYWGPHVDLFASIAPDHVYMRSEPRASMSRSSAARSRPARVIELDARRTKKGATSKGSGRPARGANAQRSSATSKRGAA